jgi:hypothetical protein
MKKSIIIIATLLSTLILNAQKMDNVSPARNSIYLEVYGQGFYNAISFDRLYRLDKKIRSSLSAGLTLVPYLTHKYDHLFVIGIPVSYNWLFGKRKNHLELGMGLTWSRRTNYDWNEPSNVELRTINCLYFTPKIGYRYQNPKGGFFFRATLDPIFVLYKDHNYYDYFSKFPQVADYYSEMNTRQLYPWIGLSFGYTLRN